LLAELQRRNVIRMAGLYLVSAWLVTQVVGTILPMFGAPEWVARTVVFLLAIGFVPALVFSWVFELTPEGLKRDGDVSPAESIAPQTARRMDRTIIVVLLLALGYFAVDKFVLGPGQGGDARQAPAAQAASPASPPADAATTGSAPAAVSPKSIAVLAFASLSADEDSEYFADGIAEEILNALAKVKDLKVAGRTSSFYFKGRNESLQAIGSTLGVAHVLDGSVRRQGDRVRISAQLIQVDDGFNRWSETFDGDLGDVFALQDRIARAISDELKLVLDAGQQARLVDAGTDDPQAYALFLHASGVFNRRESAEFRNAIALLEEALQIDPSFARAHSRLAALHAVSSEYLGADFEASHETARRHARRALELKPDFAEPHAVIGLTLIQQRQLVEGRRELERALELGPSDASSNLWMGIALVNAGYFRLGPCCRMPCITAAV
jgi:TolB-like protein